MHDNERKRQDEYILITRALPVNEGMLFKCDSTPSSENIDMLMNLFWQCKVHIEYLGVPFFFISNIFIKWKEPSVMPRGVCFLAM